MLKLIVLAVACLAVSGSSNKKRGIREGASRVKRSDIACGENEFFFRDKCYLFSTEKVLGDVTKGLCENYGGELVSFSSDEEFDFLKDTIKMDPNLDGLSYWTGAINQRHKWRWVTGEKIKNKYWVHGKPTSKRNRNCGSMSPDDDYYLVNLKCRGHYQGFICERGNTPQNRYAMESGGCKCMVSGDPHYMTCDGKKHDFQGNCTYITFLDNLHPDQPYFKVMAKNSYDPKKKKMVTLQEHITVEIFHPSFTQSYTFSFSRDNVVHLNGVNVSPPSNPEEGILLTSVGKKIMLQTVFGFWMTWDFVSRTEMRAPPEYRNNIGGMCGNCDGNPDNDYFAPDGSLTSTSNMYGNSWKSGTSCPDTDQEVDECIPERVALYGENDKCGKIGDTSGHFANCINGLGQEVVDEFLQNCIYDMCYIGGDDTLCQSIGSFYDECLYNEIEIETFRSATFCPLECPNNSVYNPSAPPCENTCAEPTAAESCPDKNMEMCLCIEGYVRSGYECVPSTECGCFGADNIYRVRDETWTDSSSIDKCAASGETVIYENCSVFN
uniref:Zonadhesin-like n=1 Tax=Saccoglossus kowalevskii TaxID=10224 RepID=A0ABM0M6P1_SACKO|nr:PREDICTED: zonadhesin-like [Saccoglossus kowalevskii]